MKSNRKIIYDKLNSAPIKTFLKKAAFLTEWFISLYAVLGNTGGILEKGYDVNIPVIKYGFVLLRYFNGWGFDKMLLAAGIGAVFYIAQSEPYLKNKWLKFFCAFMSVGTIVGQSYLTYHSWDYIFKWWMQCVVALFVAIGYYFIYLHFISFALLLLRKGHCFTRTDAKNRIERILFETHPFKASFLISFLFLLPYIIAFFPGTLHCDALEQLWRYFGIIKLNNHHPIMSTMFMGRCIDLGKLLFHSDSIGFFFYTGLQCILQCLGIGYFMYFFRKIAAPISLRWASLVLYIIFPIFPMWAITFAKDAIYYIFTLFFVVTLADMLRCPPDSLHPALWQILILYGSAFGMVLTRNNGIYVIILTAAALFILYHRGWEIWLMLIFLCLGSCLYVSKVYMPSHNIEEGEIGEALSIPLQQTARYLAEHYEEITDEERAVLEPLFSEELSIIGELYDPEISDPVKELFIAHPSTAQLKSYFEVWFRQFLKHPDTYIQAFLNQTYGYFYPDKIGIQYDLFIYYFNGWEKWEDEAMTLEHAIESTTPRKFFENYCLAFQSTPIIGMTLSAGVHVYILLGCVVCLLIHKKKRQIALLVPSLCIVLICLASPVNASFRYMLPVIVVQPLNIAWCIYSVKDT